MAEKIVFILGAGFSKPLGLPLMGNFIEKAQEMYEKEADQLPHFKKVLDFIKDASYTKNFFDSDLTNIEELYSILEMEKYVGVAPSKSDYSQFIIDVIQKSTPRLEPYNADLPGNWYEFIFGSNAVWRLYGDFVMNLLSLSASPIIKDNKFAGINFSASKDHNYEYTIISLNYDMILENALQFICGSAYMDKGRFYFSHNHAEIFQLNLAKIHGSVSDGEIIGPSWNKGLQGPKLTTAWKIAFEALSTANHIRIIGYSLPETDSYIKYLLKYAFMQRPFLRSLDVLCLDDKNDTVKRRYERFILSNKLRFVNKSVEDYFGQLRKELRNAASLINQKTIKFDVLEQAHKRFFDAAQSV